MKVEESIGAPSVAPPQTGTLPVRRGGLLRVAVWLGHMALPMLALWLLLAAPSTDIIWEHHPSHFWLVLGVAAVNVWLSLAMCVKAGSDGS